MRAAFIGALLLGAIGACSVAISDYTGPTKGIASFYGNSGAGGNCKLPARSDLMFVAWPGSQWKDARYCGACLRVTGDKGTVDVQITNKCPECPAGNLDLSTAAWLKAVSSDQKKGLGNVSWKFISCTEAKLATDQLSYVWKSGSSQYWAQLQVRGGAAGIAKVEVQGASGGGFKAWQRQDYNYFAAPGAPGPGPFTIKTTFQDGSTVSAKNVRLNGKVEDA